MISRSVTVVNSLGMRARAAARFVHLATRFQSRVRVAHQGREVDGKSIMGMLLLAAAQGSTITIAADGRDEREALEALAALHPAILRVIVMVRRAAAHARVPVSLCGEMASDPALLTLLVGLGLTEFSMTPGAIPVAKRVLGEVRSDDLRALARRILRLPSGEAIEQELMASLSSDLIGDATWRPT